MEFNKLFNLTHMNPLSWWYEIFLICIFRTRPLSFVILIRNSLVFAYIMCHNVISGGSVGTDRRIVFFCAPVSTFPISLKFSQHSQELITPTVTHFCCIPHNFNYFVFLLWKCRYKIFTWHVHVSRSKCSLHCLFLKKWRLTSVDVSVWWFNMNDTCTLLNTCDAELII